MGIVYQDRRRGLWLWRPGSAPFALEQNYFGSFTDVPPSNATGLGIRDDENGCSTVLRLKANADMRPVMKTCNAEISYVSPNGRRALAQDGTIIAIPSGEVVFSMKPPESWPAAPQRVGIAWEDDDNLLLTIQGSQFPWRTVLVRCTISTNSCERSSETQSHAHRSTTDVLTD